MAQSPDVGAEKMIKSKVIDFGTVAFSILVLALSVGGKGHSTELTYTPQSPFFGDDLFSSLHFIGLADLQGRNLEDRSLGAAPAEFGRSGQFVRGLTVRLPSAPAGQVTIAIFGEYPQEV